MSCLADGRCPSLVIGPRKVKDGNCPSNVLNGGLKLNIVELQAGIKTQAHCMAEKLESLLSSRPE
ncbi:hypothetical protein J6590_001550 [Homalodisca vitripennis]|nr:hypothetical protein J6590_001550 [Homalodisca vitripennis]